ncbi:MAG: CBS domain-containing protein [Spirosomaceae bacterium]|jgi:predicted transcriptional regulator|nr:CBS domain-containing protein [Spirosomataceae bacterium]
MTLIELINHDLPILKPTDSVGQALDWMEENRIGQLVVADADQYLGIVGEDTLLDFDESDLISEIQPQLMEVFVSDYEHIYESLNLISKHGLQVVAILNSEKRILGTITANEVYKNFSELLGTSEVGAVLVVSLKNRDYSLSEISRLIEGDNAKVLSSYYSGNTHADPLDEENAAKLTLKLNRENISSIVATLERFGYMVEATYSHEPIESVEQERYDMLMKYLSI